MKYTKECERLELPKYFKFGVELEADNVRTKGNKNGLYQGESANFIKARNWHMATKREEKLVGEGGAELVSPILTDTEKTWEEIAEICEHVKKYPGKKGEKVETNEKCGLHIHFDADCLAKYPEKRRRFSRIYAESEELLYKMCNDKNDPIRKNAINKNFRGLNIISSLWRKGIAAPSGQKMLQKIQKGTLKVSYKKWGKFRNIVGKFKIDERRYHGLNLTNIGNSKKNTIEFRMSNGTLKPEVIKQNVFLYASLIDTAIKSIETPEKYKDKLEEFYETDITEKEKAERFLELIMEEPEDRKIYIERWESVKNAAVFKRNSSKGFAKGRFKKEEFQEIAQRTPLKRVKQAYRKIKEMVQNTKEIGEVEYGR